MISYHNTANLVLGVYDEDDAEILKQIMEGLLNGIELQLFYADLHNGTRLYNFKNDILVAEPAVSRS